jgi:DNA-binding GntR family transcriptional regulator
MVTVDHLDPTPLYEQLANILRSAIKSGERPIMSESHLEQTYDVGRSTVRKALDILRAEGLIVTIAGRGTFVKPSGHD